MCRVQPRGNTRDAKTVSTAGCGRVQLNACPLERRLEYKDACSASIVTSCIPTPKAQRQKGTPPPDCIESPVLTAGGVKQTPLARPRCGLRHSRRGSLGARRAPHTQPGGASLHATSPIGRSFRGGSATRSGRVASRLALLAVALDSDRAGRSEQRSVSEMRRYVWRRPAAARGELAARGARRGGAVPT